MAKKIIHREQLGAVLHLVGRLENIQKQDDSDNTSLHMRVRFGQTAIFIYEAKPSLIKRIEKYKINDVLEIEGNFVARSYPRAKSTIAVINDIKRIRKIGIFKNEDLVSKKD